MVLIMLQVHYPMMWRESMHCTSIDIIKRRIGILIPLLALLICLAACSSAEKHESVEAKVKTYDSLAEMEESADLIVTGHKKGKVEDFKSDGMITGTLSAFVVDSIIQDREGDIQTNQEIQVLEMEYQADGIRYHVAGYTAMKEGEEYILFLIKNKGKYEGIYAIMGVNYGVCSFGPDYKMTDYSKDGKTPGSFDRINAWREEIRTKYGQGK